MQPLEIPRLQEEADLPAPTDLLILLTSYELLALAITAQFATATLRED
jgi:hypothetical protein